MQHALHFDVKGKTGKFSDTRKRLKRMQQRFRNMRERLEDALEEASANRKRAERVLVRCRQS
jgi:molecular chaperone GrpE (heat shock protein)